MKKLITYERFLYEIRNGVCQCLFNIVEDVEDVEDLYIVVKRTAGITETITNAISLKL